MDDEAEGLSWSWCCTDKYHSSCSSPFRGEHDEDSYTNSCFHFAGTHYAWKMKVYKFSGNSTGFCIIDPIKIGKDIIHTEWNFHSSQVIQIVGTIDPIHIGDDMVHLSDYIHQKINFLRLTCNSEDKFQVINKADHMLCPIDPIHIGHDMGTSEVDWMMVLDSYSRETRTNQDGFVRLFLGSTMILRSDQFRGDDIIWKLVWLH
ncbi:uncharacterized protein LOC132610166 [Lycium barbarum]|uniref:uncharacterized protein LOC132610166 n=1 Tax=Lycium barbarum TaxID=112863 RepID=UPI00293E66AE|nr:uncharacterized protein LOC132610166 [Lycium barbarum]